MTIIVFILTVALFSISKELYLHVGKKNVNCTFLSLNDFDTLLETSNYSLMNTIW